MLVDRPDKKGRTDILRVHVRKITLDPGVALDAAAALTPGFSGADLANLVNEVTLVATRRKADRVMLAGRAAEKLVLDELSTAAADDLAKATDIAREMVTRYGMDEGLGPIAYEPLRTPMLEPPPGLAPQQRLSSEHTQRRIDEAIRDIVRGGFDSAGKLLVAHRAVLERTARALLEKETLDEAALRELAPELFR